MIHKTSTNQVWKPTSYDGVQSCGLRRNDEGGGAVLVKVARGARVPMHDHPGGEEVYVVSGQAIVDGVMLRTGDYLWTPPGGVHDLRAEEDTVLFVTTPNGVRVIG